jgi:hypothetical protein
MEDNDFLPPRKKKKDYLLPSPALINTLPIVELQQARQTVEAAAENADCEIRIRTYRFLAGTWKMFYGSFTCEVCDGCVAKVRKRLPVTTPLNSFY